MKNNGKQLTQELGRFGQGSVNLFDGSISFESEDFSLGGNRMPVTISHSYDGKIGTAQYTSNSDLGINVADFSKMKLGLGFKLNVMQSIVKNGDDYVFTVQDGEEIVLKKETESNTVYKSSEEDGELEFDESTRVLKNGDNYLFDESGRLVKITDEYGNTNEFIYTAGQLTRVIDGANREFLFAYDENDFLTSITAPDGAKIEYEYTNSCLTKVTYPDDKKVEITYTNQKPIAVVLLKGTETKYKVEYASTEDKVTSIAEYGFSENAFVLGQITNIIYDTVAKQAVVSTSESEIVDTYFFDESGEIINQYSSDIVIGDNVLSNHNFSSLNYWTKFDENDSLTQISCIEDESIAKFGKHYLSINTTNSEKKINGIYQSLGFPDCNERTFSVYVKIKKGFCGDGEGVYLRVNHREYWGIVAESDKINNTNGEFVRLIVTSPVYERTNMEFEIVAVGKGEFYVCAAQVENNSFATPYQLLVDGDCAYEIDINSPWVSTTATTDYENASHSGFSAMHFVGGTVDSIKEAHQEVEVKTAQTTRETFKLSGFAKRENRIGEVVNENTPSIRLRADIIYADDDIENDNRHIQTEFADFNLHATDWQYVSLEFAKKDFAAVKNLVVYCENQYCADWVWFDSVSLVRTSIETDLTEEDFKEEIPDDTQTTTPDDNTQNQGGDQNQGNGDPEPTNEFKELIDSFGNVLTETTFTDGEFGTIYRSFGFDEDGNNLLVETDARGNKTEYDVDGNTSRNNEVTDRLGNKTGYEYDASGRTTKVISKNADGDEIANVSYSYDIFDNLTEIVRGDGLKYVLKYNAFHNLESIGIDGKSDGNLINYTYKENNGRLKEMTYANGDKMTATYDGKGQMIAEKWFDASGNTTAHYKYAYDGEGNIIRSIDILAGKMYNYMYEEGKITYACDSLVTIDDSGFTTSKTPLSITRYFYNNESTLTCKRVLFADGKEQVISYQTAENESQLVKTAVGGHSFVSTSKTDSFGRKEFDELQLGSGFVSRQFDYVNGEATDEHKSENMLKSTPTTQLVSEITFQDGRTIDYEYDAEERITKVIDSLDGVTEYTYDSLGQLLTETKNGEVINKMTYDNYGNIKSKNGIDYAYNGIWKDRLSHYDGKEITYDAQGNPLNYMGHILFWEKGRQLKSFGSTTFTYNANGIRTSKTVDNVRHDFYLDGAKILREVWTDNILETVFDNEDTVCGIVYNGTPYYFMKNLQGDVIAITNKDGEVVARYSYDAWGKCEVDSSSKNAEIAHINPFRYRSYYYDIETGLYYLQSRYYDAEVGRFLNGDMVEIAVMQQDAVEHNLFAYCGNEPVGSVDYLGYDKNYIYSQEASPYNKMKLTKNSTVGNLGCGIVAVYNVLHKYSKNVSFKKLISKVLNIPTVAWPINLLYNHFFNSGVSVFSMIAYLKTKFLKVSYSFLNTYLWGIRAEMAGAIIVAYWRPKSRTGHYIAGIKCGDGVGGRFRFYNALSESDKIKGTMSIWQVIDALKAKKYIPLCLITVAIKLGKW